MNAAAAGGPRYGLLPLSFDLQAMQADLARLADGDWVAHFNAGYHDGGWHGVALVSSDGDPARLDPGMGTAPGLATPWLARCPALRAAIDALPAQVHTARLLRLAPGSAIREHQDRGLGLDGGTARLHVPIRSDPRVEFYLDGEQIPMGEGECWYLDLRRPHRVQNDGRVERVHLVVDVEVNDWLRTHLVDVAGAERLVRERRAAGGETSAMRFERFRQRVLDDHRLQDPLLAIEETEAFLEAVVRLGAANDCAFSIEDVRSALLAGRRAWIERHLVAGVVG